MLEEEAEKVAASEELRGAVECRALDALHSALAQARAAGVESSSRTIEELRSALEEARAASALEERIAPAPWNLEEEAAKAAASNELRDAVEGRALDALQSALAQARVANGGL